MRPPVHRAIAMYQAKSGNLALVQRAETPDRVVYDVGWRDEPSAEDLAEVEAATASLFGEQNAEHVRFLENDSAKRREIAEALLTPPDKVS
jgi:hypothetical protein